MYCIFYRYFTIEPDYEEGSCLPSKIKKILHEDEQLKKTYSCIESIYTNTSVGCVIRHYTDTIPVLNYELCNFEDYQALCKLYEFYIKVERRIQLLCPKIFFYIKASQTILNIIEMVHKDQPKLLLQYPSCFPFFKTKTFLENNNNNFAYILDDRTPIEFVKNINTSSLLHGVTALIKEYLTDHIKSILKEYETNEDYYPDSSGLNGLVEQEYNNLLRLWQLCNQAEKMMLDICPSLVFTQTASFKIRYVVEQIHRYVSAYDKKKVPYQVIF